MFHSLLLIYGNTGLIGVKKPTGLPEAGAATPTRDLGYV